MIKILIVALALGVVLVDANIFTFGGRNLPSMDVFNGAPDGYLKLYYAPTSNSQYTLVGTTEIISDNRNPDWQSVNIPNNGGVTQMLKFDLYDSDSPDSDDYMGFVELRYFDIINDSDGILVKDLVGGEPGGGQIIIKMSRTDKKQ